MICPQCNTQNPPEAVYCKNCGNSMSVLPPMPAGGSDRAVTLFAAYIGVGVLESIIYFLLSVGMKLGREDYGSDRWKTFQTVNVISSWVFGIANVAILIATMAVLKHSRGRTFFIIVACFNIFFFLLWRLWPYLEKSL